MGHTALELNTCSISSDALPGVFDGYRIAYVSDLRNRSRDGAFPHLMLHTGPLSLTRQPGDHIFELVWPEQVRFEIGKKETLNFQDGDRLYFTVWYEDPDYREETVVRLAQNGTILERFSGDIRIMPNGEKWLIR